jgi:hypothetical protein
MRNSVTRLEFNRGQPRTDKWDTFQESGSEILILSFLPQSVTALDIVPYHLSPGCQTAFILRSKIRYDIMALQGRCRVWWGHKQKWPISRASICPGFLALSLFKITIPLSWERFSGRPNVPLFNLIGFSFVSLQYEVSPYPTPIVSESSLCYLWFRRSVAANRPNICLVMWSCSTKLVINSKFCESSTDKVPLLVCATQSAFLIPCNIALQMHNFIFGSV